MTRPEFVRIVRAEIDHIKKNAFPHEIENLYLKNFNHTDKQMCIYGQMTGDCDSARACLLMPKSFGSLSTGVIQDAELTFLRQSMRPGSYFTALEKYLYMVDRNVHGRIIAYLKGETDKLRLW